MEGKPPKIFISHSSQDIAFVQPLVELFEYIGLTPTTMFCSSIAGYNVPFDNDIFDYLKKQFREYDLRVIFMLSENYYNSAASLNEMGAAWVLQHKYTCILLPRFEYKDIKGVIERMRISIKLDSSRNELNSRLNELRDILINDFGLKMKSPYNRWEEHRNAFVNRVSTTDVYWKQLHDLEESKRPVSEWIFPLKKLIEVNPASYDAMYMLGTIYANSNEKEEAIKYLKMTVDLSRDNVLREKAAKKLKGLGFVI